MASFALSVPCQGESKDIFKAMKAFGLKNEPFVWDGEAILLATGGSVMVKY